MIGNKISLCYAELDWIMSALFMLHYVRETHISGCSHRLITLHGGVKRNSEQFFASVCKRDFAANKDNINTVCTPTFVAFDDPSSIITIYVVAYEKK